MEVEVNVREQRESSYKTDSEKPAQAPGHPGLCAERSPDGYYDGCLSIFNQPRRPRP